MRRIRFGFLDSSIGACDRPVWTLLQSWNQLLCDCEPAGDVWRSINGRGEATDQPIPRSIHALGGPSNFLRLCRGSLPRADAPRGARAAVMATLRLERRLAILETSSLPLPS
jgi:hypothetical protein